MTDHKQEQEDELEALQSIFAEGTEFVSESPTEFFLTLLPDPTGETVNHVSVTLHVTYVAKYPDVAPEWELEKIKGLSEQNEEKLNNLVGDVVESSLGMAMVYSMAECCQDFLKENNFKALSMHEEMLKRQKEAGGGDEDEEDEEEEDEGPNPEEEWKGLQDKPCCKPEERITKEGFEAWKLAFDAEMIASGVLKREEHKAKTGKAIFMDIMPADDKANGTAAANGTADKAPLVYDAALFGEEEEDLDDLDDDED